MIKKRKKIAVVFGTRPEAIKLAPVILALKKTKHFKCQVIVTAQHRQMLDQVLKIFNIAPDIDLNLMEKNQNLAGFAAKAMTALDKCFKKQKPNMVLVQGDTTTTWVASLAAFYNKIKIGHIEAGLRTYDRYSPFPEEINRVLTSHLADLHFAPTKWSAHNLIKEGIPKSKIYITGNTVIDSLFLAKRYIKSGKLKRPERLNRLKRPFVLITGHRRENFGQGLQNICNAIKTLANKFPNYYFVYPVHLNPNVRNQVMKVLKGEKNIILTDPVDYLTFVWLMDKCKLILTDSGGIQEEAPAFGKPVLVMRDVTERPEAVQAGTTKLAGTDAARIVEEVAALLTDDKAYATMANAVNPYGDGKAAYRIVKALLVSDKDYS